MGLHEKFMGTLGSCVKYYRGHYALFFYEEDISLEHKASLEDFYLFIYGVLENNRPQNKKQKKFTG